MSHITKADWPADRQAIRFVVLSRPNRLGLQRIKSLLWEDDAQTFVEQSAHLDTLIASARRRGVVCDSIERIPDLQQAA